MGSLATKDAEIWVMMLVRLTNSLEIQTWQEIEDILRGYLWVERVGGALCRNVWSQAEQLRARVKEDA